MTVDEVTEALKAKTNPKNIEGMKRFGIRGKTLLGIGAVDLRKMAKEIGKNHDLAIELWNSGIHEVRMIAVLIDSPEKMTEKQIEKWVSEIDSWDICDTLTGNLLDKSELAIKSMSRWAKDEREYIRRTPFSMMSWIAVHNKELKDEEFEKYFQLIKETATDERNFVKKAVNWALRQIGKRNMKLRDRALEVAKEILSLNSKAARWIASDTIRELSSSKTVEIIKRKNKNK